MIVRFLKRLFAIVSALMFLLFLFSFCCFEAGGKMEGFFVLAGSVLLTVWIAWTVSCLVDWFNNQEGDL